MDPLEAALAGKRNAPSADTVDPLEAAISGRKTAPETDPLSAAMKGRTASQEEAMDQDPQIQSVLDQYKEVANAESNADLMKKWSGIIKSTKKISSNRNLDTAGRQKIKSVLQGIRTPLTVKEKPGEDLAADIFWQEMTGYTPPTGEQAQAMRTEVDVEQKNAPTPEELAKQEIELDRNPAASTLQLIAEKLAPVTSVPAEVVDTLRRQAQWMVNGSVGDPPEVRWSQAFETGSRGKDNQAPMGLGDTFVNSFREVFQREPERLESVLLQGLGLASEWVGPLDALKVLRPLKEVPRTQAMAARLEKALERGGLPEFAWQSYPERKISQAIREAEQAREATTYMGGNLPGAITGPAAQDVASAVAKTIPQQTPPQMLSAATEAISKEKAFPRRIEVAREKLREIAKEWGGNPEMVDRAFLRDIGPEGINFERAWAKWMPELKMKPKAIEEAVQGTRDLPLGAEPQQGVGKLLAPLARVFTHEGAVAKGVGELARESQSRGMAAQAKAEKVAAEIEGSLGKGRSVELSQWWDARQRKAALSKWVTETDNDLARLSYNYSIHRTRLDNALATNNLEEAGSAWDNLRIDLDEYSKNWEGDQDFTAGLRQSLKALHVAKNQIQDLASKGGDLSILTQRFRDISAKAQGQFDNLVQAERLHLDQTKSLYDRLSKDIDEKIGGALKPQNADEQKAVDYLQREFDRMHADEEKYLGHFGYAEAYLPRIETQASKGKHLEYFGAKPQGKGRLFFQRKRLPSTAEVSIDWNRTREFHRNLGDIYQARAKAHNMAIANAKAEEEILKAYSGTPVPLTQAQELERKERGLVRYSRRYGADRGQEYWVDKGTAMFMDRALTPGWKPQNNAGARFVEEWDKIHGWLKGRMTILRPGFVARNFLGGNLYNMWLADVKLTENLDDAAKLLAYRRKTSRPLSLTPSTPAGRMARSASDSFDDEVYGLFTGQMAKGFEPQKAIAGKSMDEWLKLAEEAKIFGSGQIGGELASEIGNPAKTSLLTAINPMSNRNVWARGVRGVNTWVEDWSKTALFMDRVKKGFSPAEAAADVAKYLFNYDELSSFNKLAGKVVSFPTWLFKNFGLQLSSLMMKPDKVAKYLRARTAIQDLDPLSPEEARLADVMPDQLKAQDPFILPFSRSEKGNREYFIEGGFTPLASLNLLSAEKIANGDAKGLADAVAQTVIGMLAPPIKVGLNWLGKETEQQQRGFWMGKANYDSDQFVWAPSWVSTIMNDYRKSNPEKFKEWVQERVVVPIVHEKDGADVIVGYKWSRSRQEMLENMDPGFGVLRRLFPQFTGEEAYKGEKAFWTGMKASEISKDRAVNWQRADFDRRLKEIQAEEKTQQQLQISPRGRPYRQMKGAGK